MKPHDLPCRLQTVHTRAGASPLQDWCAPVFFALLMTVCVGSGSTIAPQAMVVDGLRVRAETPNPNAVWTLCANEYGTCTFSSARQVKYGTATQYVVATFADRTDCNNGVFGEPALGYGKSCWYDGSASFSASAPSSSATAPSTNTPWTFCASEYGTCAFSGTHQVKYGTATRYVIGTYTASAACNNGVFGDPAPGYGKSCWYDAAVTTPGVTRTGSDSSGSGATGSSASSANAITCTSPSPPANAPSGTDLVEADTPGGDHTRLFAPGTTFLLSFVTRASANDTLVWQIADAWDNVQASGQFPVASGSQAVSLTCTSTLAGYFAISASLASTGGSLPSRGTRPGGIATFGVLPDVSALLPAVSYAHQDLHRFGGQGTAYLQAGQACCGDDGYRPLYPDLGLSWANDNRNWYVTEPNGPNTFNPNADNLAPFFKRGDLMRLIQLDGIPGWASPTGKTTHSYAPKSPGDYQNYMTRVGQESNTVRTKYFPNQRKNYYQVTWEPDFDGGLPWLDTDANFVAMYKATWQGIHTYDPNAVVMGVTAAILGTNTSWLTRLAQLGIGQYLDGVTVHGYYDAGTSPSHPPERYALDSDPKVTANALPMSMRALRHQVATLLKPGAKLFVTETGISYDVGTSYGPHYPTSNVLYAQGAVVARTHLILLGEGADLTFVFYAADYPGQPGYGLFFDVAATDTQGAWGATNISPKPAALVVAAMTRILDGTNTLGPIVGVPAGVYAYAFQRLNNGKVISALWTHNNAAWSASTGFSTTYSVNYDLQVDAPGTSGQVSVLDMMGNTSAVPYRNGVVALTLTEAPIYVISSNASVAKAHVTTPQGYVAQ